MHLSGCQMDPVEPVLLVTETLACSTEDITVGFVDISFIQVCYLSELLNHTCERWFDGSQCHF